MVWALRDVTFTVNRGEVLGIVGRNGAGKSTLLKILSRVTGPSDGSAEIRGRVGSLLEVGTGFHPELTGRENVYLNGAILGMRRGEIARKFDEIVAFSGVEKFLDTPVKFYSSGMYLRLAFGVAAHLEPDILLVDEVLAVGDLEFQRRCLGRMKTVAREGRTVLFVSHNLTAVSSLTERSLLLQDGHIEMFADTESTLAAYHASIVGHQGSLEARTDRTGTGEVRFRAIEILDPDTKEMIAAAHPGQKLLIRVYWRAFQPLNTAEMDLDIRLNNSLGAAVASFSTRFRPWPNARLAEEGCADCLIPALWVASDDYTLDLWAGVHNRGADYVGNAASLSVANSDFFGTGQMPLARKHGAFLIDHSWRVASPKESPLQETKP